LGGLHAYNSQFVDEDGVPEMQKIPAEDRASHIIIFKPGPKEQTANGDLRQPAWRMRIPHELKLYLSPVTAILNGMSDEDYTAAQGVADVASNFLPIGQAPLDASSPGNFISSLARRGVASANPLIKYPIEAISGQEMFSNTPIVGTRVEGMMPEYEYTLRTPPGMVAAGQKLGVSPDRLNHLVRNLMPGVGQLAVEGAGELLGQPDRPTEGIESPTEAAQRAPITGQFNRRFSQPITTNAEMSRQRSFFYDFAREVSEKANTISGLAGRDPWKLQNIPQSDRLLAAYNPTMTKFSRALSEIDKARETIIRNPGMVPADKQTTLRRLFQAEQRILTTTEGLIRKIQGG
jgi:hypothetical protein